MCAVHSSCDYYYYEYWKRYVTTYGLRCCHVDSATVATNVIRCKKREMIRLLLVLFIVFNLMKLCTLCAHSFTSESKPNRNNYPKRFAQRKNNNKIYWGDLFFFVHDHDVYSVFLLSQPIENCKWLHALVCGQCQTHGDVGPFRICLSSRHGRIVCYALRLCISTYG